MADDTFASAGISNLIHGGIMYLQISYWKSDGSVLPGQFGSPSATTSGYITASETTAAWLSIGIVDHDDTTTSKDSPAPAGHSIKIYSGRGAIVEGFVKENTDLKKGTILVVSDATPGVCDLADAMTAVVAPGSINVLGDGSQSVTITGDPQQVPGVRVMLMEDHTASADAKLRRLMFIG